MNDIRKVIKSKRLYFDGGYGTVFQERGLAAGVAPEMWNLNAPDKVVALHKEYIAAGSNIITTNTFGVNSLKYDDYGKIIRSAVGLAKKAAEGRKDVWIAFDMGPTGKMLKPFGDLGFEEAVSVFSANVKAAERCGVDLVIIETMNDCYETKAALLAVKENSSLPVFVTNAYGRDGKLMTGADPVAMISMLESMGADAIGMNCSFGPDAMLDLADDFINYSSVPVIVNPNAGLPRVENGKTVYDISPDEFSEYMARLAEKCVHILGGCCGTTPEYIEKTVQRTKGIPYRYPKKKNFTFVSSYTHAVSLEQRPVLIGERINPTGKPLLKEAVINGNTDYILNEAIRQTEKGVHILDVNVGVPCTNEAETLKNTIYAIQAVVDTPLQIDTSDIAALGGAMRMYNGKPLVNSVNGEDESMNSVFPLIKKYGGAVIALTMDKKGIPATAKERVRIAEKIIARAAEFGIEKKDIIADPLCLTVSADSGSAEVTLEAVKLLKKRGIKTSLGVSNISFGLPARDKINAVFFSLALDSGLDCAIMNPFSEKMTDVYYAYRALHGQDRTCSDYVAYASASVSVPSRRVEGTASVSGAITEVTLKEAVIKGLKDIAAARAEKALSQKDPLEIIDGEIIPALNEVGEGFEKKKLYLPQLLMSAEAAVAAFEKIKKAMPAGGTDSKRCIILATVKGDIHDIGKNIVKVLLESHGFKVYDLGKDVAPEKVLNKVRETGCMIVGLSALMTTTVASMEDTIKLLRAECPAVTVIAGGAVMNDEYAAEIDADAYCADAMETVRFVQNFYES